jgi:epoxyqueuosine reductase
VLVDENQHVDREGAARAGVGFYGKNTLLITRRHGSWVVLGTLVTNAEIERSAPLDLDCGSCTLCIEACPTGALDDPGVLDSTKCLSYWSQAPGSVPAEYRKEMGSYVYGCDICQDVCPWNRRAATSDDPAWQPRASLAYPRLLDLCRVPDQMWRAQLKGSAMQRAGLHRIRRSLAYAAASLPAADRAEALDALSSHTSATNPMVQDAIEWARG